MQHPLFSLFTETELHSNGECQRVNLLLSKFPCLIINKSFSFDELTTNRTRITTKSNPDVKRNTDEGKQANSEGKKKVHVNEETN